MIIDKKLLKRFWEKVNKKRDDECWEWQACKIEDGYGRIRIENSLWLSHRVSYILHYGEIPEGFHVLHKCDNPPCVNPHHLFLGKDADNAKDMVEKGRSAKGEYKHIPKKLSVGEIILIRIIYDSKVSTLKFIAKMFKVHPHLIYLIGKRKSWAWLED